MGISGTDVAKLASDIVVIDDSLSSVLKSVLWGRNVTENVKRFIQFQMTLNITALFYCLIGAIFIKESPLSAI